MISLRPVLYAALALVALISVGIVSLINLEQESFIDTLWLLMVMLAMVIWRLQGVFNGM
ncbi:hypothetical protein Psch_00644 [Pelotomaculum schinkii]|uniref:Uncharacterized protein n=1 Tax=Pelotomaculum schinkii TaxID=78350 RepID=A0A4Y7REA4_9FIRM|nr:hypothetical protein Psch_00644 [Pelotomaculum schinkii]